MAVDNLRACNCMRRSGWGKTLKKTCLIVKETNSRVWLLLCIRLA